MRQDKRLPLFMLILWVMKKQIGEFVFFLLEMHKVTGGAGSGGTGDVNWHEHLPVSRGARSERSHMDEISQAITRAAANVRPGGKKLHLMKAVPWDLGLTGMQCILCVSTFWRPSGTRALFYSYHPLSCAIGPAPSPFVLSCFAPPLLLFLLSLQRKAFL